MKYIKTYEDTNPNKVLIPNKSDKQYWVVFNNLQDEFTDQKSRIKSLLKFLYHTNYSYIFDAVWAQNYTYNKKDYKIGEKSSEYRFEPDELKYHQEIGNMRLATPEEIEQYILLSNSNKYNL